MKWTNQLLTALLCAAVAVMVLLVQTSSRNAGGVVVDALIWLGFAGAIFFAITGVLALINSRRRASSARDE